MQIPVDPIKKQKAYKAHLPESWMAEASAATDEDLFERIQKAALNYITLAITKSLDTDIAELRVKLATATETYTSGMKVNLLKQLFAIDLLRERGADVPDISTWLRDPKLAEEARAAAAGADDPNDPAGE